MKFHNQALKIIKRHLKILITIATIILLIMLIYAFYLFWHVNTAMKLSFIGAVIGLPTSILITALSSNYEFNRERKDQEIHVIGDNLYRIIISLREIKHKSLSLSKWYTASVPRKIIKDQNLVSLSSLVDSPNISTINTCFDQLQEQIYMIPTLRNKLNDSFSITQSEVNALSNQIDHLKVLKSSTFTENYIDKVNNDCLKIYVQSRELLNVFKRISSKLYQ